MLGAVGIFTALGRPASDEEDQKAVQFTLSDFCPVLGDLHCSLSDSLVQIALPQQTLVKRKRGKCVCVCVCVCVCAGCQRLTSIIFLSFCVTRFLTEPGAHQLT